MCALFGWLDYAGKLSPKFLTKLTQALANAAEERGTDASGISYIKDGSVTIFKRPKPAHKLKFRVPDRTVAVMGHTRFTTQGSQKLNYNNHPFRGNAGMEFAFAHNGVLHNDKELRFTHNLPDTKIETDSYVAVQLLEQIGNISFDSLGKMAEAVMGGFTFTLLDVDNNLWFVKGSSPMHLLHFPELGIYIYASTKSIMDAALKGSAFTYYKSEVIPTVDGDLIKIDKNGNISNGRFKVHSDFGGMFRFGFFGGISFDEDDNEENEALEQLLSICHSYGVDEEDILDLYDMGYSIDEIEMCLTDPHGLRELLDYGCIC